MSCDSYGARDGSVESAWYFSSVLNRIAWHESERHDGMGNVA